MSDEHTRPEDIDFDHKKTETQLKFNLMSLIQTVVSLGFGLIALITATGYLIINRIPYNQCLSGEVYRYSSVLCVTQSIHYNWCRFFDFYCYALYDSLRINQHRY